MSRYETVNNKTAPNRRRWRLLGLLSSACVLATGCSLPRPPTPSQRNGVVDTVAAGFDAYKAGDQAGVEGDIQKLSNLLPTDETQGVFLSCSPQGFDLRRIERAKRDLEYLDLPPAPSMGPEEKYIYFQQLVGYGLPSLDENGRLAYTASDSNDPLRNANMPSEFECQGAAGYDQSRASDGQEGDAIQAAGRARLRTWLVDLRQTYGPELNARMQNAAVEVHQLNLSPYQAAWQPPMADPPKI